MLGTKDELFSGNGEIFNQIYENLFTTFMKGIKNNHKMEYYSISFGGKEIKGRALLPSIVIDTFKAAKRTCELFRIEYQETKCYPDYLIKKHFPELFEEIYTQVLMEDTFAETETQVDMLIDSIINKNFN